MYLPTQLPSDELYHYGVKGMTWGGHTKAQVKPGQKVPPSDQQLMADVLKGKYGNGADRKKKLGSRYAYVQDMVNQKLLGKKYKTKFPKKKTKQHVKGKKKVKQIAKKMAATPVKKIPQATKPAEIEKPVPNGR